MAKVLVVYGTAYGQTERIARRILGELERQGHTVSSLQRDWQKRSCSPVIMRQRPRSW
jgi:flavodoxin